MYIELISNGVVDPRSTQVIIANQKWQMSN